VVSPGALLAAAVLAVAMLPGGLARAEATLPRVASMNLCTDQLLMLIADPDQIVSVSILARDPALSPLHALAEGLPVNHARAEEIFVTHPDVVLADVWSNAGVVAMLRRLGLDVEQLDPGSSLDSIRARITAVGRITGHPERAAQLLAAFDARLAAIARPAPGLRAAVYGSGGFGYGPATLEGQILALAGFENVVSGPGLDYGGPVPLERLIMLQPDLVIAGSDGMGRGTSRAQMALSHPALRALPFVKDMRDARWSCGAPALLGAVEDLAALGREIEKRKLTQ